MELGTFWFFSIPKFWKAIDAVVEFFSSPPPSFIFDILTTFFEIIDKINIILGGNADLNFIWLIDYINSIRDFPTAFFVIFFCVGFGIVFAFLFFCVDIADRITPF